MKFIENNVVTPGIWNAEWFYELSDGGFIAAVHVYDTPSGECAVLFNGQSACFLYDNETNFPATADEIKNAIVDLYNNGDIDGNSDKPVDFEQLFGDDYQEIGQAGLITNEEMLDMYGFTMEQKKDIEMRMDDIGQYFFTGEEG